MALFFECLMINTYEQCVNYIYDIPKFHGKNTLEDTAGLYSLVCSDSFSPHIIHVAGTNGKGSTCAFMNQILIEAGYRVGLFISPHLVSINERIRVNNRLISDEDFILAFHKVLEAVDKIGDDHHPSFFEFLYLMAMYYFEQKDVDYIVLETGLGGRLDATNSVRNKDLTVITKIGFDHMEYLGNTLEEIASEKGGIVRPNVPLVFFDNKDTTADVFRNIAKDNDSMCYSIARDNIKILNQTKENIDFSLLCDYYKYDSLRVSSSAAYQAINASLAVMAIRVLNDPLISDEHIKDGLKFTFFEGRMEQLLPGIYVDGAHNIDGIEAFLNSVSLLSIESKRHLLFSVVADKDYAPMVSAIFESNLFESIHVAPINSKRALDINHLKSIFSEYDVGNVYYYHDIRDALSSASCFKEDEDTLFIAGSLYLVGEVKSIIGETKNA